MFNWINDAGPPEAPFCTSLFRLNKAISNDALQFAYSANSFSLNGNLSRLQSLGVIALASIKRLTLFNNFWAISQEVLVQLRQLLDSRCTSLEVFTLETSAHFVVQSLPYLQDFLDEIPKESPRPKLVLDLYVLDRHFSFDAPEKDYRLSLLCLHKKSVHLGLVDPFPAAESVKQLPRRTKQITIVSDVGTGFIRALDEFLLEFPEHRFVKTQNPPSSLDVLRPGRSTRIWYIWE
ncbi:hypothetical protein B0A52_06535 [Exophiala mesophila]|uniref:Uncharacterized protein n=1 Tax=Exophiala mesophila TaxID=212818 RepID=A0A438N164_EXOME|nr:hypothetical protein B0A52_06535 [Exophiala mesophila]